MKIIIISNAITPHQIPLCEAFLAQEDVSLTFIEGRDIDKEQLPIGWRVLDSKNFVVSYEQFHKNEEEYKRKILCADAVIIGSAPIHYVKQRLDAGKLTFLYSERIYRNWKEELKWPYHFFKFQNLYGKYPNLYLLSAGAYVARDYRRVGCFKNRAYKWGYFTNVDEHFELDTSNQDASYSERTPLMWCARFLSLKHPELPVQLAAILKAKGYKFFIDMYGSGEKQEYIISLIEQLGVDDCVRICGNLPNSEILREMRRHKIFLFTSDFNEGWGAVANEAMSNGCTLVASDAIGSIPYLVQDGVNGLIFKSCSLESLYQKVSYLLDNEEARINMSNEGLRTMKALWSPKNAANAFIQLVIDIISGNNISIQKGPCSIAPIYNNNWYK